MKPSIMTVALLVIFGAFLPFRAWSAETLTTGEVRELVDDRTWEMLFPMSAKRFTYWDWRKDGTLCARVLGGPRSDPCADDGTWRIDGVHLCWELTWLGREWGGKSQCISVRHTSEGHLEAHRKAGLGVRFFDFTVLE